MNLALLIIAAVFVALAAIIAAGAFRAPQHVMPWETARDNGAVIVLLALAAASATAAFWGAW